MKPKAKTPGVAVVITVKGETKPAIPKNGRDFSLEEAQAIVGGYVQMRHGNNGKIMLLDEDGKVKTPPHQPNEVATNYAWGCGMISLDDHIVGDVLVCDSKMFK